MVTFETRVLPTPWEGTPSERISFWLGLARLGLTYELVAEGTHQLVEEQADVPAGAFTIESFQHFLTDRVQPSEEELKALTQSLKDNQNVFIEFMAELRLIVTRVTQGHHLLAEVPLPKGIDLRLAKLFQAYAYFHIQKAEGARRASLEELAEVTAVDEVFPLSTIEGREVDVQLRQNLARVLDLFHKLELEGRLSLTEVRFIKDVESELARVPIYNRWYKTFRNLYEAAKESVGVDFVDELHIPLDEGPDPEVGTSEAMTRILKYRGLQAVPVLDTWHASPKAEHLLDPVKAEIGFSYSELLALTSGTDEDCKHVREAYHHMGALLMKTGMSEDYKEITLAQLRKKLDYLSLYPRLGQIIRSFLDRFPPGDFGDGGNVKEIKWR
jgi:hypothetical protein